MSDAELTKLLCTLLGDIPGWTWRETAPPYAAGERAIHYGAIPASPDVGIGVRVYSTSDNAVNGLASRRAQIRFRGRPGYVDDADNMAQLAFLRLQRLSRVGGISDIRRDSMTPLGADKNDREQRSDNYTITLDNQEASR
ncbi:minor capsid protein [Microbacterium sp. ZW T5_45]|uniref:phage tail terminator protein n=1 Tax=Microbacterium sp. ZW T5_45 TaxID=3378080 RepID=UPI0038542832